MLFDDALESFENCIAATESMEEAHSENSDTEFELSLARGQAVAYVCHYHHIWDIAPGLLAATESGCVYAHLSGREYHYGEPALVVANSEETLKRVLKTYEKL